MRENVDLLLESLTEFRDSEDRSLSKDYQKAFKKSSCFVAKKINAQLEFIPIDLISQFTEGKTKKLVKTFEKIYGKPVSSQKLDKKLSKFYKKHNLKRDIENLSDPITYFFQTAEYENTTQPEQQEEAHEDTFFDANHLLQYVDYGGEAYDAGDEALKTVGRSISQWIVKPTNYWLQCITSKKFIGEPERYWQVAGKFKSFTWGKLSAPDHQDKKIFFVVGVDYAKQALFYKLECLRSGTSKLSEKQILKFDYLTEGFETGHEIPFSEIHKYNWDSLTRVVKKFVKQHEWLYHALIDYLWYGDTNASFKEKLIEVDEANIPLNQERFESSKKLNTKATQLTLNYEQAILQLQGKPDLASKVTVISNDDHNGELDEYDILSFHTDGSEKRIMVKATASASLKGFDITEKEVAASERNDSKSYLYLVFDYNKTDNLGKLNIIRGGVRKRLALVPVKYTAGIQ